MLDIDTDTGLVGAALQRPSPNHDERPDKQSVDSVIIHAISLPPAVFEGDAVERLFLNRLDPAEHPFFREIEGLRVSSHLFIRRDGSLVQFVPLHRRAWHAGVSRLNGRGRCNDFAIGVELEGDDHTPFESAQYDRLIALLNGLMTAYPDITPDRVVGHCHVAPERKTDPGPHFQWSRLTAALGVPEPSACWPEEGAHRCV